MCTHRTSEGHAETPAPQTCLKMFQGLSCSSTYRTRSKGRALGRLMLGSLNSSPATSTSLSQQVSVGAESRATAVILQSRQVYSGSNFRKIPKFWWHDCEPLRWGPWLSMYAKFWDFFYLLLSLCELRAVFQCWGQIDFIFVMSFWICDDKVIWNDWHYKNEGKMTVKFHHHFTVISQ